jgi:hypothetical protein
MGRYEISVTSNRLTETGRFDPFDNDATKPTLALTNGFERRLTATSASAYSRPQAVIEQPNNPAVRKSADHP